MTPTEFLFTYLFMNHASNYNISLEASYLLCQFHYTSYLSTNYKKGYIEEKDAIQAYLDHLCTKERFLIVVPDAVLKWHGNKVDTHYAKFISELLNGDLDINFVKAQILTTN